MKKYITWNLVALTALMVACAPPPESTPSGIDLFDGKTLEGWSHYLANDAVKKEDVWRVSEGILICKGEPLGYLYTDASFQDFKLELEWRWAPGKEPGNSGVLLRIAGEAVSFLPQCVEAQLQHENAGDIWAFYGAHAEGPEERRKEIKDHDPLGDFAGVQKIEGAEHEPGEWNHYTLTLKGEALELRVNGKRVNTASGLDVLAGPVGLQSEGAEIHFRKIRLTSL